MVVSTPVIGNPPYDVLASEELGYDVSSRVGVTIDAVRQFTSPQFEELVTSTSSSSAGRPPKQAPSGSLFLYRADAAA